MRACAPALAGHARRRWIQRTISFVSFLRRALQGDQSVVVPRSLWLPVSYNDLSVYCGAHGRSLDDSRQSRTMGSGGVGSPVAPLPSPHLRWVLLRPNLLQEISSGLGDNAGRVWAAVGHWVSHGFPLGYSGPGRSSSPLPATKIASVLKALPVFDPAPLQRKLDSLIGPQGPSFGPYPTPPFSAGIVSPVLGVLKKDGSVRPVYHCSFPRLPSGEDSSLSLNGGISRDRFWFPTFDSVASWLLQWILASDFAPPLRTKSVVFKLDFESAFRQVPVQPCDWPLLMLYDAVGKRYFLETCAAFGTRISADLWLRVANVWKVFLHAAGFPASMIYVDDLAVVCPETRVWELLELVVTLEQELGTRVHWGKVFPDGGCTPRASVLGLVVDFDRVSTSLEPRKVKARLAQACNLLEATRWPTKEVERLAGAFNFFATALPSGRLLLGPIYALTGVQTSFVSVGPNHAARSSVAIWCNLLRAALRNRLEQPFLYNQSSVFWLATDASDEGMGGVSPFGAWSVAFEKDCPWSINVRELAAVWVSVTQVWSSSLKNCLVHVFVDNETARVWSGHPPSARASPASRALILNLQRTLALRLQKIGCVLIMHRIPTHDNCVADRLSREPSSPITRATLASWRKIVTATVEGDSLQHNAAVWLASRATESPLLWWDTKPTSLGGCSPAHVQSLFPSCTDPHVFHRRPLLHSLLQRPLHDDWAHDSLDPNTVAEWLRSQDGPGVQSL